MGECFIEIPSEKEMSEAAAKELSLMKKARALSDEERMGICDLGYYNDTIKGYLIAALQVAEFSDEDIRRALDGMRWALSEKNAADAAALCRKF